MAFMNDMIGVSILVEKQSLVLGAEFPIIGPTSATNIEKKVLFPNVSIPLLKCCPCNHYSLSHSDIISPQNSSCRCVNSPYQTLQQRSRFGYLDVSQLLSLADAGHLNLEEKEKRKNETLLRVREQLFFGVASEFSRQGMKH